MEDTLKKLKKLSTKKDVKGSIFFLGSILSRNFGGINSEKLVGNNDKKAKELIHAFFDQICLQLTMVADDKETDIDILFDFFDRARHSYGRSALLLSGGNYF